MSKNQNDLHYLAGLIDGEGSIILGGKRRSTEGRPKTSRATAEVSIASTDLEVLEWCKENFGGVISSKKVYDPTHKPSYAWRVRSRQAFDLCAIVGPLLKINKKRSRAAHLIKIGEATPRNGKYTSEMLEKRESLEAEFFTL